MIAWRLGAFGAALALAFGEAAADMLTTTAACSTSENMVANELVVAYASSWTTHSCSETGSSCSEACKAIQVDLATGLPNCLTTSGTNFRAYYASLQANCSSSSSQSEDHDRAAASTSDSGSGSGSDVGATVTTPAPTKRSGASAMGFAGMCGFFAVLAFGHIY